MQERVEEEPEEEMLAEAEEEEDLGPSIEELIERAQMEQVRRGRRVQRWGRGRGQGVLGNAGNALVRMW